MVYFLLVVGLASAGLPADIFLPLESVEFYRVKKIDDKTTVVQKSKHDTKLYQVPEESIDSNGNTVVTYRWVWQWEYQRPFGDTIEINPDDYNVYTMEGKKIDAKETFKQYKSIAYFAVFKKSDIDDSDLVLRRKGYVKFDPIKLKETDPVTECFVIVRRK